jgi:PRTRC genetic system protein C
MEAKPLIREFHYQGTNLPDPNPSLTVDQARDILATSHPELATAAIDGPVTKEGGKQVYTFIRSVGTKG